MKLRIAVFPLLVLSGCTLGPDYQLPDNTQIPETFEAKQDMPLGQASMALLTWRQVYQEPQLQVLIDTALANNIDLKLATERVYQASQALRLSEADRLPSLDAVFEGERLSSSREFSTAPVDNTFELAAELNWELDLWGRLRRGVEQAESEYQATEADWYAARVSLISQVANLYYDIQNAEHQIKLTEEHIRAREKAKKINQLRHDQGVISGLDVRQSAVELMQEKIKMPALRQQRRSLMYQLAILLGDQPKEMQIDARIDDSHDYSKLPVGLPSELLQRRPDIIAAERRMQVASAAIGIAETGYFPDFILTGEIGGKSRELSDIFTSGAETWAFGLEMTMPILDFGRTEAEVNQATSSYRQAQLSYRQTVLNALRDVSEAIDSYMQTQQELMLRQELLTETQEYLRIAGLKYRNGVVSYLELLDAQRNHAAAEQDLSAAINARQQARIGLYKSLGGGWQTESILGQNLNIDNSD